MRVLASEYSLYSVLSVEPPDSADPGETVETKARETIDNDAVLTFLDSLTGPDESRLP